MADKFTFEPRRQGWLDGYTVSAVAHPDNSLGFVYESKGDGWCALHEENTERGWPQVTGFRSREAAGDFIYSFRPPVMSEQNQTTIGD